MPEKEIQTIPQNKIQTITVFLGANEGTDPRLKAAARELGSWIGQSGRSLVYGGSKCGLMGVLAESVLESGGRVIGVEPRFFVEMGLVYDAIDELIVTETMTERKAKMVELGDAFIAFPGGTGTLEEISEIMSAVYLGHMDVPCILYDLDGYYEGLRAQLAKMAEKGLSYREQQQGIHFARTLEEIKEAVERDGSPPPK